MSIKLQGNGLWESSRMMLPEHKEAILENLESLDRKQRIDLDDSEKEMISLAISDSLTEQKCVTFVLFGEWEEREVSGIVQRVDRLEQNIYVKTATGACWINFNNIVEAELSE